jgi:hypothetical protein
MSDPQFWFYVAQNYDLLSLGRHHVNHGSNRRSYRSYGRRQMFSGSTRSKYCPGTHQISSDPAAQPGTMITGADGRTLELSETSPST